MTVICEEIETNYVDGSALPWVPFAPYSDEVLLRYYKIDPVAGQIVLSMRLPQGVTLPPHYHTGVVVAHTVRGAWRYVEHDWIARAGDTVYETAGSIHAPEALEDTEVFLTLTGELLFYGEDGQLLAQENWKTSAMRYSTYCAENGIEPLAITSFDT